MSQPVRAHVILRRLRTVKLSKACQGLSLLVDDSAATIDEMRVLLEAAANALDTAGAGQWTYHEWLQRVRAIVP